MTDSRDNTAGLAYDSGAPQANSAPLWAVPESGWRNLVIPFAMLAVLLYLGATAQRQQQTITGKVVGVSDGDTITVLDNSKIYHLPNCPDYSKVSERNRVPFETEA